MEGTEESNNNNNREFLNPPKLSTPSCFMLPPNQDHVTIRPQVASQLPIFKGTKNENPYSHIKEFEDIGSIFREANTPLDIFRMKLFPLSLKDEVKTWLNSLRPYGIENWGDLQSVFLQKFFPTHRTSELKNEISNFKAMEDEKFFCMLVSRNWEEPIVKETPRYRTMNMARTSGVYTLPKGLDVQAKFATIMRRLDDLEAKKVQERHTSIIPAILHIPTLIVRVGGIIQIYHGDEVRMASFSSKETDFRVIRLMGSKVFNHKVCHLKIFNSNIKQLVNIRTTLSQFAVGLSKEKGKFLAQPQKNSREVNEVSEVKKEYCNTITHSEMGKNMKGPNEPTVEKNARNEKEYEIYEEVIVSKDKRSVSNHLSFPSTMQRNKVGDKTLEILEVLKQVKINIPLLDMIKKVSAYAKFLKDLCTMKRRIKLSKKAFLTEQVSAIIENKAMVKYKDPGCATILVQIGDSFVERALLDLGASVIFLPYSIYKQLGLGELKATTITLSLADRSIKVPREVVKDVLVQIEKFYYPVDFVVLDIEPLKKLEMNVFNLCKQPMDHDDVEDEEACLIEALVQEYIEKLMEENIDEFFSTIVKKERVEVATKWKEKCIIQSLNSVENDEETTLTEDQEIKLLKVLKENERTIDPTKIELISKLPLPTTIKKNSYGLKHVKKAFERLESLLTATPIDAKARLIRWILLLQEFNIQIKDKQGVENVVANHISRVKVESHFEKAQINHEFPDDTLCAMEKLPWFANIVNYLATRELSSEWNMEMKKNFLSREKHYAWDDPYLYKFCLDQIIWRCVPENEQQDILQICHEGACGGHFALRKTSKKNSTEWILLAKLCLDFMRPFLHSFGNVYILVGVDYVSKWVETMAHKSNDHKVKYGVRHKVSTPYHPQTNRQAELANREIKIILTKIVNATRKNWSTKLKLEHCAYWAIKKMNFDLDQVRAKRKYDLNELEAYQNEIKEVFPYSTATIRNPRTGNEFKVNGQHLKHFIEIFGTQEENLHFLDGDVQKG
ncbi:hypothetical protein AAG906_038346 [Vitis piasezkii]